MKIESTLYQYVVDGEEKNTFVLVIDTSVREFRSLLKKFYKKYNSTSVTESYVYVDSTNNCKCMTFEVLNTTTRSRGKIAYRIREWHSATPSSILFNKLDKIEEFDINIIEDIFTIFKTVEKYNMFLNL